MRNQAKHMNDGIARKNEEEASKELEIGFSFIY